ncbi:MAG: hypothetical protein ACREB6_05615, partial [Rhodospirillales bacterium]
MVFRACGVSRGARSCCRHDSPIAALEEKLSRLPGLAAMSGAALRPAVLLSRIVEAREGEVRAP